MNNKFYLNYPNNPNCPNSPNYPNSLGMFQTKANLEMHFLADPGKARGCSTKTFVINSLN